MNEGQAIELYQQDHQHMHDRLSRENINEWVDLVNLASASDDSRMDIDIDVVDEELYESLTWFITKEQPHWAGMTYYVCSDDAINSNWLQLWLDW